MTEVPSYRLKQSKIPTNDARIRWGIGRPDHSHIKENSESIASEWAKLIREKGAALLHGKLNPYWFDDSSTPQPIREPPFADHGQINIAPIDIYHGAPPNTVTRIVDADIYTHHNDQHAIQYLIMSQPVNPNFQPDHVLLKQMNELIFQEGAGSPNITQAMKLQSSLNSYSQYNTEKLGGKFSSNWREISWIFWADQNQTKIGTEQKNIVSWRGDDAINVNFHIFLPDSEADNLFIQMQTHPDEIQHLLGILYPKITGDYPLKTIKGNTLEIIRDVDPLEENFSRVVRESPTIPIK